MPLVEATGPAERYNWRMYFNPPYSFESYNGGQALVVKSESFLERVGNLISDTVEEIEEIVTGCTGRQRHAKAHNIDETRMSPASQSFYIQRAVSDWLH